MDPKKPANSSIYRIADVEYSNSQFDEKIIGIFRFESSGQPKRGPTLFVLAEIEGIGYVYDQLIDVVNNEAEHSRNLTSSVEQDPVTRFEKIVQNVNAAARDFLANETAPINWARVNMYLLELSEGHLCLAGVGRFMNMFLQAQEDGSYKTFDLFGSLDQPADVNPEKLFSNIICGDVSRGDVLIAGSKNFERLRNELRLKERLTTLPPVTAALEITQDLEHRGIPDDFIATIISCLPADEPKAAPLPPPEKEKSTTSIESLRRTEADTLRFLAPTFGRKEEAPATSAEPRAPRIGGGRNPLAFVQGLFSREQTKDVANLVNLRGMHAGFGTLFTKRKKTTIFAAIGLVLAIIGGSMYYKHRKAIAAENAAWNQAYDAAKASIGKAEGESQYVEERARATLAQAVTAVQHLDTSTPTRKEAVDKLQSQMTDVRKKLQRITNVNTPEQVFALPDGIAPGALGSPTLFQGNLLFADRSGNQIVAIDLKTKAVKKISLPDGSAPVVAIAPGKSSAIAVLQNKTLLAVTISDGTASKIAIGSSDAKEFTNAITYASKLYVLDAASQQIWKFANASGGFGNGTKYLQAANADLSKANAVTIDSNVYVLSSDGKLVRFYGGGQDGFALASIDPALTSGKAIWTDPDANTLAIADPDGKRVAVFTKEGRLVGQYLSPAFSGPVGLAGDASEKKLYVVDNSNKVFVLSLP